MELCQVHKGHGWFWYLIPLQPHLPLIDVLVSISQANKVDTRPHLRDWHGLISVVKVEGGGGGGTQRLCLQN